MYLHVIGNSPIQEIFQGAQFSFGIAEHANACFTATQNAFKFIPLLEQPVSYWVNNLCNRATSLQNSSPDSTQYSEW